MSERRRGPQLRLWLYELQQLPEYSTSLPTGVCPFKTWKRNLNFWIGAAGDADPCWYVMHYWPINGLMYTKSYEAVLLQGPWPEKLPELRFKTQCTTAEVRAWQ